MRNLNSDWHDDKDSPAVAKSFSRREALRMLAGAGAIAALTAPAIAQADIAEDIKKTEAELKKTQEEYERVKKQLDVILEEYEALSLAQSQTKDQIEDVHEQLGQTQVQIDWQTQDLANKQERLGKRVASAYKSGPTGPIDVLLSASTFEELTANIYYLDKISLQDRAMIDDVREAKAALEQSKLELEHREAELEVLSAQQAEQIAASQAKQYEVQEILEGLSDDVKKLIEQRDAELLEQKRDNERKAAEAKAKAQAEEEARKKAAAEAAAAAAAAAAREQAKKEEAARLAAEAAQADQDDDSHSSTNGDSHSSQELGDTGDEGNDSDDSGNDASANYTGSLSAVLSACNSTPTPGAGLCAGWVSNVFVNAGLGFIGGNANDMYAWYCYSSNLGAIQPGMIVAVSSHAHTSAGRIWGHVGIYIGGGMVMDNIGYIRTTTLSEWVSYYGTTVTPRWGWLGGIVLS